MLKARDEVNSLRMNLNDYNGYNVRNNITQDFVMGFHLMQKVTEMRIYNREIDELKDQECTICLSFLKNNTYNNFVVKTECSHIFHYSCLLKSLLNDSRCPNCRTEVIED